MIILCITLCLLMIHQTYKYHNWQPYSLGLLILSSTALTFLISLENSLFSVEVLIIVLLCLIFTMRNKILGMIITIKYLTYHFILFVLIHFVLYVTSLHVNSTDYLYVLGFLSLNYVDARYHFTDRLYKPIQTSMELITAFFALTTTLIIYELRDPDVFTSIDFSIVSFIILTMFVTIFLQIVVLTNYFEKKDDITKLKNEFSPEYNRLLEEHLLALKHLSETTIDASLKDKLNIYFKEHQLPMYSDDTELNFILYYAFKTNTNNSFISKEALRGYSVDLLLFYTITLLRNFDDRLTIVTSPLEDNTLVITMSREEVSTKELVLFFKHFKIRHFKIENKWYLDALRYLYGINRIKHQIQVTDSHTIKLTLGDKR